MQLFNLSEPYSIVAALLTLGAIFVNGWTDAPNAIATAVSTRAISVKKAVFLAAVCNFLGVMIMTIVNPTVMLTVYGLAQFETPIYSSMGLCAALLSVIVWAVAAWAFGLPTSESHALMAAVTGASVAINGSFNAIGAKEWQSVILGLLFSVVAGLFSGYIMREIIEKLFRTKNRTNINSLLRKGEVFGAMSMAFMHGAQDGQKFMGIFLLAMAGGTSAFTQSNAPLWLAVMCSVIMALGSAMGGRKIIKSVGMDTVKLRLYQGFCADTGGATALLLCSMMGFPVSTTHTKTMAVVGTGLAGGIRSVNFSKVREMAIAWGLTFPVCGVLGFVIGKIILL